MNVHLSTHVVYEGARSGIPLKTNVLPIHRYTDIVDNEIQQWDDELTSSFVAKATWTPDGLQRYDVKVSSNYTLIG